MLSIRKLRRCDECFFVIRLTPRGVSRGTCKLRSSRRLFRSSYSFGAPLATSMRNHAGTSTTRTDIYHILTVGIAKVF